jgi:hypothetical protein
MVPRDGRHQKALLVKGAPSGAAVIIRRVGTSSASLSRETGEEIAEHALGEALARVCHPGSWQGMARGLAWRVVSSGARDPRSVEPLSELAEAHLGSFIDDALWRLERRVHDSYGEYLELRPGDHGGALKAARLDAAEEALLLVFAACERVVELLRPLGQRAA